MNAPKRISRIEYSLLSPKDIRRMSVRKIIWPDTYDDDGIPYPQGLMDLNLGVIDPGLRCKTCDQKAASCPGHFGHIELARPVVHVGYTRLIRKLLQVTCRSCSRLLLTSKELERLTSSEEGGGGSDYVTEKDIKNGRICPHCGKQQLKISFEKPTTFSETWAAGRKQCEHTLTPIDIRARLERIPYDDLRVLGVNPAVARPEWTILTVLPVPPLTMRPSIILEDGQRSEDDLTHKLADIIKINQRVKESQDAGAPPSIMEDLWELLQYHVTTYLDNEVANCPLATHQSGKALKTLSQRLNGKEGRFRASLSGKRVNFSARTVISPDPNIQVDEAGVPLQIANTLTIPVQVTEKNIDELRAMICNGVERSQTSEKCRVLDAISPQSERYRITPNNQKDISERIEVGWTVERQLKDNDTILLNRYPSLHRCSILAHRAVVMDAKTIHIHPSVCSSYGVKFDGDEMNLHLPRSEEARAEAHMLISVRENLVFPRDGSPVVGVHKDILPAIWRFTRGIQWFTKGETLDLLKDIAVDHLPPAGKVEDGLEYWSNRQIFSLLLPTGLTTTFKSDACTGCIQCKEVLCPRDAYVRVFRGCYQAGLIDSKALDARRGLLTSQIYHRYGSEVVIKFIKNVSALGIRAAMLYGISFGLDDITPSRGLNSVIHKQLTPIYDQKGHRDWIDTESLYLSKIRQTQAQLDRLFIKLLVSGLHKGYWNAFEPKTSGPIAESIMGCLGQQYVHEHRISEGFRDRTLPHFKPGDVSVEARGFVKNGYRTGLNPVEFFFHAAHERSNATSKTFQAVQGGYLQRRLSYALQDLSVNQDGSVRLRTGRIVQFSYGEDGTDPGRSSFGEAVDVKGIVEAVLENGPRFDSPEITQTLDQPDPITTYSPPVKDSETGENKTDSGKENSIECLSIRRFIQLYYKSHPEKCEATSLWVTWPSRQVVNELIHALSDTHSAVRGAAVDALSTLGDARAVQPLIGMLEDVALEVRGKAAEALGKFGDISAIPKLQTLLQDPFCYVRGKASQSLRLLTSIAETQSNTDLDGLSLKEPDSPPDTQEEILPVISEVLDAISSTDKNVIITTPNGPSNGDSAFPNRMLGEDIVNLPESERHLLSIESLLNLLAAESPDVRLFAVQTLGERGDVRAISPITKLLNDTEYAIFTAALEALEKLKGT